MQRVRERIERACATCGRNPVGVTLIAVSKTVPVERIQLAYDAGQRHFGESRLQEAAPKIDALPEDIVWHFIGRLQSNKAKMAARRFAIIHTLEGENQLREIAKGGACVDGLIEINVANETQKSGISPEALDETVRTVLKYDQIRLRGLMTVGPLHDDPESMRPHFRLLAKLAKSVDASAWISMGMSNDLEVAIQEGSTHVRVGTAIFGERI